MYGYGNSLYLTANKILASSNAGNPPVNTVAPAITGTAQEGQVVTCSTGTWTGTAPITYAYQWKRNGSNIGSATNSTYTLVTADVSQSITCQVTATNDVGNANATSNIITPTSAIDPDAQAFITAASITDPTQQSAINTLVTDLKGYSIWTKFKAIYPIVGGSASSHAVNLKTPGTYNLTFATGWTHSSTGMTPSTTYANTSLIPSSVLTLNSVHLSYYSRTNNLNNIHMGADSALPLGTTYLYQAYNSSLGLLSALNTSSSDYINNSVANSFGLSISSRTSSTDVALYKQGIKLNANTKNSLELPSVSVYIGARNSYGAGASFDNKQCAFASIGDGLTDTEAANFDTAVQAYQTTLNRQV